MAAGSWKMGLGAGAWDMTWELTPQIASMKPSKVGAAGGFVSSKPSSSDVPPSARSHLLKQLKEHQQLGAIYSSAETVGTSHSNNHNYSSAFLLWYLCFGFETRSPVALAGLEHLGLEASISPVSQPFAIYHIKHPDTKFKDVSIKDLNFST